MQKESIRRAGDAAVVAADVAADGYTYTRRASLQYLHSSDVTPVTGDTLLDCRYCKIAVLVCVKLSTVATDSRNPP